MEAKVCKKGQRLLKGKCFTQKNTTYEDLPNVKGKTTLDKIANFYMDLGWDGQQNLDPKKVIVNESDWLKLIKKIEPVAGTQDQKISAGLTFTNYGPSGSNKIKRGKVKLVKGWV